MRIATAQLDNNDLNAIIDYLILFFSKNKSVEVNIMYGWDCNTENLYTDIKTRVEYIKLFIQKSEIDGIFTLGKSDLYIQSLDGQFGFQLCHESDAHFEAKDMNLLEKVEKDWSTKYKTYRQAE